MVRRSTPTTRPILATIYAGRCAACSSTAFRITPSARHQLSRFRRRSISGARLNQPFSDVISCSRRRREIEGKGATSVTAAAALHIRKARCASLDCSGRSALIATIVVTHDTTLHRRTTRSCPPGRTISATAAAGGRPEVRHRQDRAVGLDDRASVEQPVVPSRPSAAASTSHSVPQPFTDQPCASGKIGLVIDCHHLSSATANDLRATDRPFK